MNKFAVCIALALLNGCGGSGGSGNGNSPVDDGNTNTDETENVAPPNSPNQYANSSVCVNPTLYQVGTKVITAHSSDNFPDHTDIDEVTEQLTYEGYADALKIETEGDDVDNLYVLFDDANKTITTLGQQLGSDIYSYKPNGLALDYDLNVSEERSYPTITVELNGEEQDILDVTHRYSGSETITVPAGTFDTCVMILEIVATTDGEERTGTFTQYVGVGNGLMIREELESKDASGNILWTDVEELVSATINGAPVR
ncbi:hypothetical protein [Enterovibrio norvegicus]|uniref:hypothetical protein n=1 Tax=Enterovibrio norvegicus TaxID=188144 RepID=UPI00354D055E